MVSFPPVSPPRPYTTPLSSPIRATCPAHLIFSILSPAQYWVRSTNHLAPRYAVSSIPPLPRPSYVQIFSSTPATNRSKVHFTPQHAMKAQAVYRYSANLSSTSALDYGGWSAPRSGRFTHEKGTPYRYTGGWVSLGQARKISSSLGFESRTVQPVTQE